MNEVKEEYSGYAIKGLSTSWVYVFHCFVKVYGKSLLPIFLLGMYRPNSPLRDLHRFSPVRHTRPIDLRVGCYPSSSLLVDLVPTSRPCPRHVFLSLPTAVVFLVSSIPK